MVLHANSSLIRVITNINDIFAVKVVRSNLRNPLYPRVKGLNIENLIAYCLNGPYGIQLGKNCILISFSSRAGMAVFSTQAFKSLSAPRYNAVNTDCERIHLFTK